MEQNIQETWMRENGLPLKCIIDVGRNAKHLIERKVGNQELSGEQSRILAFIFIHQKADRGVCQKDVEKAFRLRKSSVSSVLQGLEKKGYIRRESEQKDARRKVLSLTEEGKQIHNRFLLKMRCMEKKVREALSEEEFSQFLKYMEKIDNQISRIDQEEKNDKTVIEIHR